MKKITKNILFLIYKLFNYLYQLFLKQGTCGQISIFIEEPLIFESIESCIDSLDKIVIGYYKHLSCVDQILKLKKKYKNKVKLIPLIKQSDEYWMNYQTIFKKCRHKNYVKIDVDQIYNQNELNRIIKHINTLGNYNFIGYMGLNIYNSKNQWATLGTDVRNNNFNFLVFNGGWDHFIIKKSLFTKYIRYDFDNRILERIRIPFLDRYNFIGGGIIHLHFGPTKIRLSNLDDYLIKHDAPYLIEYSNKKSVASELIKKTITYHQAKIFYLWLKDNEYVIEKCFNKVINSKPALEHLLYKRFNNV